MRLCTALPALRVSAVALGLTVCAWLPAHGQRLDLSGYLDESGAITVQHQGDTVDPYFALQALLLAHAHGLDISGPAAAWSRWLAPRYQSTGRLDRHCKQAQRWQACKPADADDASLALWLAFLKTRPDTGLLTRRSAGRARQSLETLRNKHTGLYQVSWQVPVHLFMDNLEVWSVLPSPQLARAIQQTFWDASQQIYKVSTQTEHPHPQDVFYPDATAQLYPLLVRFPLIPGEALMHYQRWMARHRSAWLAQMDTDFAWGLIALLAWEHRDLETVRCWQKKALPLRHGLHWIVTDEVVFQIVPLLPPSSATQDHCT